MKSKQIWKKTTLGELVTLQRGHDLPKNQRKIGNYPIVSSSGIIDSHNEYKAKGPGVVIGRSGSLGSSHYIEKDYWPLNTTLYSKQFHDCDPKFVYYFIKTLDLENYNAGTSVPTLNRNHIHPLEIFIPSTIDEQEQIGKTLNDLDTKIENLQNQNKILEQITQAIFKSWFVDFDGVTEFVDSELGKIPEGWHVVNLPDIIEINPVRNLKKGIIAPYLGMTDIPIHSSRISNFYLREFTSGMKFMNGDTLVARITPSLENGKTAFVDFLQHGEIGWGSTEYIVLRPKFLISPEYGYCFARTDEFRAHAISNMTGTSGRQRVPENCFDKYKIVKPPIETILAFGDLAKKIFLQIKNNAEILGIFTKTKDILLPKLMSGEIRV